MATLMYTCCPECSTCFRITDAQLAVAQGKVRCGKCSTVFNAKAHLTEQLPSKQQPAKQQPTPSPPTDKAESDLIDRAAPSEATETERPAVEKVKTPSTTAKFIDTTELPDSSALAESLFAPDEAEEADNDQDDSASRYQYSDITDEIETDSDIDEILQEMNEQLSLAMEPSLPDTSFVKNKAPSDEEGELIGAIDKLLDEPESEATAAVPEDTFDVASAEEDEHAIEKAFLHEVERNHPDALSDSIEQSTPYEEEPAAPAAATPEEVIPLRLRDSLQIEPPRKRSLWLTLAGILFSLLLLALFAGQLALFRNTELANLYPPLQPWLNQFCSYLPCRYDIQRDVEQIKLLSRDVRAHPKVEAALLINAAMVNQAEFKQPYPDLLITLFDLSGNVVAKRRFTPADYMGKLNSPFLLMTPNTPVQITLEVVDPGNNAINFEFEFL